MTPAANHRLAGLEKDSKPSARTLLRISPPCYSVVFIILFLLPVFLHAQTARQVEMLLETSAVSYEDAAALVLEAAGALAAPGPAEAFSFALEQGWLPKGASGGGTARLDGLSLLIMRSFNIKGGFFYGVTKAPHYAYRELVYRNIILGNSDPEMAVSGDLLLSMVNRVLSYQEANQL